MRVLSKDELKIILDRHKAWLAKEPNGEQADLSGANLRGADLRGADLSEADLRWADLSGANLLKAIVPIVAPMPTIKQDILSRIKQDGCKLDMSQWHTCETTHCMAGWATTIHPQGKLLESMIGPNAAGALIFNASVGEVPNFYATNEKAMAWLSTEKGA